MALNIRGWMTIENSNQALRIRNSSGVVGLDISSNNIPLLPQRPYFVAQGTGGWTNLIAGAWNNIVFNTTLVNNGSDYSTSTGRFTAPVAGVYYFEAHLYHYKNPDTSNSGYTHPLFRINNSYTYNQASASPPYRLRSRTNASGAYSTDTQINDIFRLNQGDYVEYVVYCSGSQQWYQQYSLFSGYFIG